MARQMNEKLKGVDHETSNNKAKSEEPGCVTRGLQIPVEGLRPRVTLPLTLSHHYKLHGVSRRRAWQAWWDDFKGEDTCANSPCACVTATTQHVAKITRKPEETMTAKTVLAPMSIHRYSQWNSVPRRSLRTRTYMRVEGECVE
jgi:hypothetical protein